MPNKEDTISLDTMSNTNISDLYDAAKNGNLDTVQALIGLGADVNQADKNGETALHYSTENKHNAVTELLIKAMSPFAINIADKEGSTALHLAAANGHTGLVKLMIETGANVNQADKYDRTALHLAAKNGHKDLVELLLPQMTPDDEAIEHGWTALQTALHYAVRSGHTGLVQWMIEKGANVNQADENGYTVLHVAAAKGQKDVVDLLVNKGADLNQADDSGKTALHRAAERGHKDVVEFLASNGANVNQANNKEGGLTALHSAAENGHKDIVEFLASNGANVHQATANGWTPLHLATKNGHKDVVGLLIAKDGIDVKSTGLGRTALQWAVEKGHKDVVELLLAKMTPEEINQANGHGQTALHSAARVERHDMVKLLIESGKFDLNAEDREGHDIWTYYPPDQEGSRNMVELLMTHGAKYPEPKSDGELAKIVSSSQSGHSQGKLAQDEYNKFKEGKDDANIKAQLEAQANKFIELLNAAHLSLNEEDHIKMVKDLIGPKYADITQGQGADFIKKVGEICEVEESQLNPQKLENAIDSLTLEKKAQLAKYSQDKIDETIGHYTENGSKPFHGFDLTTKDFFGVFGAKIADKIAKKEDIGDILPNTLKEILDAGTMYGSGGASCATGMVNKMFNSSPQLFEDKIEVVKKESFEFEGFVVDYDALLTVATMKLKDSGDKELVKKILDQSELTQLEVQKVGAKVYEILKETKNNENLVKGYKNAWTFSEIVHYGEDNVFTDAPEKIQQFSRELDYKTLSDQTYSGLFKKHSEKYVINQDKIKYPLTKNDLEVDITSSDIISDHAMNTTDISSDLASDIDLVENNTDHDITMSGVDAYNNEDSSM
jgi:ankyrin repeat protein